MTQKKEYKQKYSDAKQHNSVPSNLNGEAPEGVSCTTAGQKIHT